jgi:maltose O-acetyltransferase
MSKTEREKMLANEPYIAADPELVGMMSKAQSLLHAYNLSHPHDRSQRQAIIKELFGSIGDNFKIEPSFRCDYGCHIYAGENLYINYDCVILDCNYVYLGNNVFIAPKVQIYTAYHPLDAATRRSGVEMAAPITIGDDVWIGGGTIVCPGVSIGNNAVIGAGSVVTKNIPNDVVAVGNPARAIGQLEIPAV